MSGADRFDLGRFVEAQDRVADQVRRELAAGRKQTHWMWFIFPQIAGLGSSPTARRFAIQSLDEAGAYLGHPVLGARLREHTALVLQTEGGSANEIFGSPDDMKFRSSMTLFEAAAEARSAAGRFGDALDRFFGGERDRETLDRI